VIEAAAKKAFGLIPWWLWPLALSLSIGAGVSAYQMARADLAQAQAALSDLQREHAQAATRASEAARAKETQLRADAAAASAKLQKEKQSAKIREDRLVADIRRGAQRLSIAASCPAASQAPEDPEDPGIAPGSGPESPRAELDQSAAEALVAIAIDGDNAIRERNACIQQYNAVREALNGPAPESPGL
jgi:prophage endopeptidase